jgi:hypothetical protein
LNIVPSPKDNGTIFKCEKKESKMNTSTFKKRIYNLPTFTADVKNIFDHMDALRRAARGGRVIAMPSPRKL